MSSTMGLIWPPGLQLTSPGEYNYFSRYDQNTHSSDISQKKKKKKKKNMCITSRNARSY